MKDASDPARRSKILSAAAELLSHYGLSKTTVADIAREAEVGVGTVYLEFPSKGKIIEALAADRHGQVLRAMSAAANAPARPPQLRLKDALDARTRVFLELAGCGTHAADLLHRCCKPVEEAHDAYRHQELAILAGLIEEGISAGLPCPLKDSAEAARALLHAYQSCAPPLLFRRPPAETRRLLTTLHVLVLGGLFPGAEDLPPPRDPDG